MTFANILMSANGIFVWNVTEGWDNMFLTIMWSSQCLQISFFLNIFIYYFWFLTNRIVMWLLVSFKKRSFYKRPLAVLRYTDILVAHTH